MRLIEKMEADVAGKIAEIEAAAKARAAEAAAEADAAVARLASAARLETGKRLELEKARRSSQVLQAVRKEEAELKRDLIDRVYAAARKKLDELDGKAYDGLFETLAAEALTDLKHAVSVSVREGDKKRAQAALKAAKVEAEVSEDLDGRGGGLVVSSEGGEVFIDNTLATRLERSRLLGVTLAGSILFGESAGEAADA